MKLPIIAKTERAPIVVGVVGAVVLLVVSAVHSPGSGADDSSAPRPTSPQVLAE